MADPGQLAKDHPTATPDHVVESGVEQTFPASDPVAPTTSMGARAVPPQELMHATGSKPAAGAEWVTLSQRFADPEAAKLALETLVREGPVDRRSAEIGAEGGGACLHVTVPKADAARLRGKLKRVPGTK